MTDEFIKLDVRIYNLSRRHHFKQTSKKKRSSTYFILKARTLN